MAKSKSNIEVTKEEVVTEEDKKRRDWEYNDSIICTAFCELMLEKQKLPSTQAIADKCNLTTKTVERHLADFDFKNFVQKFRAGNEKVMMNLFRQAATGKSDKIIRLWFEVTEGIGTRKFVDITSAGQKIEAASGVVTLDPSRLSTDALKEILKQADELPKS